MKFLASQQFGHGDHHSIMITEKFGNRDYVLTISGVTPDHDAEFTCLAKNNAGEAKSTAQLLIDSADGKENNDMTYCILISKQC